MCCRVCAFRVKVWESYRPSRSFGYGYESVTELPEVPGIVERAYITHRSTGRVQRCCTRTPGIVARGVENSQSSGYGYESYRINKSSGTGMKVMQKFHKFRVLWHERTELTVVPGTGLNVLQNLHKFRVRVIPRAKAHPLRGPLRGEFDLKWRIQFNLHGMFSQGQCPRGNLS